ncbi:MAG: DUF4175 domain-containing protein [Nitrospirae bacterium]|nr:MAG: DUF4175 domain-containing protein [Nitrospirota bacterium]
MSRIKELRASFDKQLDALEHQALALEAQLTQTKDQAMQRLELRKQQLRDLLKQVQADVQKSKEMAEQAKSDVQAKLEHLQVQLALGKADARDTFEEQTEQKLKGAEFESGRVWEDLVGLTSTLEAEFEALKDRFESEKAKQQVMLESKKQELLTNLVLFKDQLKAKRVVVQAKADVLETDLREGLDQIKAGVRRFFE